MIQKAIFKIILLFYNLFWLILLPWVFFRLLLRSRHEIGYRQHLPERLAFRSPTTNTRPKTRYWIHAVSVGETQAAQGLIQSLLQDPDCDIILTHMTPTGRKTGHQLFEQESRVIQAYLPYDILPLISRFIKLTQPSCLLIIETEVWPSLLSSAKSHDIPVILVNGRLSERSARRYQKLGAIGMQLWQQFDLILAQSAREAQHFSNLGAQHVQVTGSLKFDVPTNPTLINWGKQMREKIAANRPVWIAASTREGEEPFILTAQQQLLSQAQQKQQPRPLLILVPRHPQRFDIVEQLCKKSSFNLFRRSQLNTHTNMMDNAIDQMDILLGDSMGEMSAYYAMADNAVVGGSFLPLGGQNLIEPCLLGLPVLFGPYMFNFLEVSQAAIQAGCAKEIMANQIAPNISELSTNTKLHLQMSQQARAFAQEHQGALAKTIVAIQALVSSKVNQYQTQQRTTT